MLFSVSSPKGKLEEHTACRAVAAQRKDYSVTTAALVSHVLTMIGQLPQGDLRGALANVAQRFLRG